MLDSIAHCCEGCSGIISTSSRREWESNTDVATLANHLAGFLAPLLPYLLKAGEKAVEKDGKKMGIPKPS